MKSILTSLLAVALAALALPVLAAGSGADSSLTTYSAVGLDGHPPLRSGGVVDVTIARELGAIEHHRLSGAAPDTTYQIIGEVFLFTACSEGDPFGPIPVPEGSLTTNQSGNGGVSVTFPGGSFDTAPDTFWVRWNLNVGHETAYRSGCVQVELTSGGPR